MDEKKNRRIKVDGTTLTGQTRKYEFELVPPKVGVALQNEYRFLLMSNATSISQLVAWIAESAANGDLELGTEEDSLLVRSIRIAKIGNVSTPLVEVLPQIITPARMEELAARLLAGGSVDGEMIDSDGMCDLFGRNISELDCALFHAALANFPYLAEIGNIVPLLLALIKGGSKDEEKGDTTPASDAT